MKTTKSRKVLLGAATIAAALAVPHDKAKAATDSMSISAKIIAPIKITATKTLKFGTLAADAVSADTVTVDAKTGTATPAGKVQVIGTNAQAGSVKVTPAKSVPYTISMNTATVSVTETAGGVAKMTVKSFKFWDGAASVASITSATLKTAATVKYPVGGTLKVAAAQTPGIYKGTVKVNAAYK